MPAAFDVSWHWRAWRARARWLATHQRVEQWLLSLDLKAAGLGSEGQGPALILLGGSAGWMMSDAFLAQFRRILLVDLDPWAGTFFKWNHRAALSSGLTTLTFQRGDVHAQWADLLAAAEAITEEQYDEIQDAAAAVEASLQPQEPKP